AVLEARLSRPALPAVKIDVSDRVQQPIFGLDVDDPGRSQTVLRRQHSSQQADRLGEARAQHLSEAGDAFGKLDAIYPVLKVGVVSAHVELSVRVLRDARRLQ